MLNILTLKHDKWLLEEIGLTVLTLLSVFMYRDIAQFPANLLLYKYHSASCDL